MKRLRLNSKDLQNNTLKRLQVTKVPHSIIVSRVSMRNVHNNSGLDYCIAVPKNDKAMTSELGIGFEKDHPKVFTKTMTKQDVFQFQTMRAKDEYVKVMSSDDGAVYEWVKLSLKKSV